ncbi:MAG: formylglycine-generating enzyme family protein [Bryobacteraceae bacterium]|nr:formylglycine-generating enzyme family protein [Bryobacteraceae bacterium]
MPPRVDCLQSAYVAGVMTLVPAGAYVMGCSSLDSECFAWEKSPKEIRITRGFWIGQTEVTQRAYQRVMGSNPSRYQGLDRPVDQVSWHGARNYCRSVGMRLPTESEWEYAARGGDHGPRFGPLEAIAWFDGNSRDQTHTVAQKRPNKFGLYDTLGNVWEWVQDSYGESGEKRILRGGSFYNLARDLRVSKGR